MERRDFLQLSTVGVACALAGSARCTTGPMRSGAAPAGEATMRDPSTLDTLAPAPTDDAFWHTVRGHYAPPPGYLDLDHANTAPTARPVFDAFVERARRLSAAPAEGFGTMWKDELEAVARPALAAYLGTQPRQLAFVANTTTALNTVLHGFAMRAGDEILVTDHEYPDMVETVLQRSQRDGLVVRTLRVPAVDEDRLALVERVVQAITPRTRLLLISHVSAWSGEVLPVAEVTAAARARGVAVLVDAAQSVGILDVDFAALGCDFLGASLHKGLGAPLPTGVLVMRPERMRDVAPLHPPSWLDPKYPMDQYEWSGTFNMAGLATATDALAFQRALGAERKRARLRRLGDYWQDRLQALPGVTVLTPRDPGRSFGPAAFAVDGLPSKALARQLRERHAILVQDKAGRHSPFANAIRVSPGAHATLEELDRLVAAVGEEIRAAKARGV